MALKVSQYPGPKKRDVKYERLVLAERNVVPCGFGKYRRSEFLMASLSNPSSPGTAQADFKLLVRWPGALFKSR